MKKIILILILILEFVSFEIPPYVELNNLAIIEEITVIQEGTQYTLKLKEIIPIKKDQGINYEYKTYQETSTSLSKAYNKLQDKTKKKLYLKKVKSLTTNIKISKDIIKELDINPSTIHHPNNLIIKNN